MLRRLLHNTAFSAGAFALNGFIGLALVPLLLESYGLAAFGLLAVARMLLPAGALALLDLGASETATQAVARARGSGNWSRASGQVTLLLVLSAAMGATVGMLAVPLSGWLATVLKAGPEHHEQFVAVLIATGCSFFLLFPGLVAEGVTKGYERFLLLRSTEVGATLLYGLAVLVCVWQRLPFSYVAFAFLGTLLLRYGILLLAVMRDARATGLKLQSWDGSDRAEVFHRSWLMANSRALGWLLHQFPGLLVGILFGPVGAGLYDIISRLPRFLKAALGLLATAILPVAAVLEGRGRPDAIRVIGHTSFWLIPLGTFPLLFSVAGLSPLLLHAWVGPELARYWPWLLAMLVMPVLHICLTVPQSILHLKRPFIAANNRMTLLGVAAQYVASLLLAREFGPMAFVAGMAFGAAIAFPLQWRLAVRELEGNAVATGLDLSRHLAFGAGSSVLLAWLSSALYGASLAETVTVGLGWAVVHTAVAFLVLLDTDRRAVILRMVRAALGERRPSV